MNQRRSSQDRHPSDERRGYGSFGRGRSPRYGYEGIEFGEGREGRREYEDYDRSRSRSPSYRGGETGRGFEDERYGRYNEEERLGEASRGYQGRHRGEPDYYEERHPRRGGQGRGGSGGPRRFDYEREASRQDRDVRRSGSFRNQDDEDYYDEDDRTPHGRY